MFPFVIQGWRAKDPNNPLFAESEYFNKMVAEGKLGKKTGEGFYGKKWFISKWKLQLWEKTSLLH